MTEMDFSFWLQTKDPCTDWAFIFAFLPSLWKMSINSPIFVHKWNCEDDKNATDQVSRPTFWRLNWISSYHNSSRKVYKQKKKKKAASNPLSPAVDYQSHGKIADLQIKLYKGIYIAVITPVKLGKLYHLSSTTIAMNHST